MKSFSLIVAAGLLTISTNSMARSLVGDLKAAGDAIDASSKKISDGLKFFTSGDGLKACNELKAKVDVYNLNAGEIASQCSSYESQINGLSSDIDKAENDRKTKVDELNIMIERASWSDAHIKTQADKSTATLQGEITALAKSKSVKKALLDKTLASLKAMDAKYQLALSNYRTASCSGSDYDCEVAFINLKGPEVTERAALRATRDSLNTEIAALEASISEKSQLLSSDVASRIAAGKLMRSDAKAKVPVLKNEIKTIDASIDSLKKSRKTALSYLENTIGLKKCQDMGTKQLPAACVQVMK